MGIANSYSKWNSDRGTKILEMYLHKCIIQSCFRRYVMENWNQHYTWNLYCHPTKKCPCVQQVAANCQIFLTVKATLVSVLREFEINCTICELSLQMLYRTSLKLPTQQGGGNTLLNFSCVLITSRNMISFSICFGSNSSSSSSRPL